MNNFYIWMIASIIVGWCLRIIYEDFTRPVRIAILGGKASVSIDPEARVDKETAAEAAQVINTSILAMSLMGQWLEELQLANPRLPEECLTAQQWIDAALSIIAQSAYVDPNQPK